VKAASQHEPGTKPCRPSPRRQGDPAMRDYCAEVLARWIAAEAASRRRMASLFPDPDDQDTEAATGR
jgi:hypothetical protein